MEEINSQGETLNLAMAKGSGKETVLRVKRKRNDIPFESLWLEVTPRPVKRHEPNLAELSLGDATTKAQDVRPVPNEHRDVVELSVASLKLDELFLLRSALKFALYEGVPSKLLFRRVETLSASGVKELSLPEFLLKVKDKKRSREKQEPRQTRNTKVKQGQLLAAAKEHHEVHSRTARFEQVWRSRRRDEKKEEEDPMQELFHLYDVVHVDVETESAAKRERRKQAKREAELREGQLLCNYLPLLREVLPEVAAEVEAQASQPSETEDGEESSSNSKDYVYDVYTLDEEMDEDKPSETTYPTIQIMDDENQDWREESDPDYDTEDSNDENNPNNDYPEEEDDEVAADEDGNSDSSFEVNPYSKEDEEYDTVLSDEEREIWRPRR